ncbi:MAG: hypothetical protein R6T96_13285, partial [Longimicrobiales bacterium]
MKPSTRPLAFLAIMVARELEEMIGRNLGRFSGGSSTSTPALGSKTSRPSSPFPFPWTSKRMDAGSWLANRSRTPGISHGGR